MMLASLFFIVSSVDLAHSRAVMKQPTDVTQVISIPSTTPIRGERGEVLKLSDLRAGDTVYVELKDGVATSIRRGPMTREELRKRYLPELPK